MRVEYAQYNVAVTLVCPGPVYSKITEEAFTGKADQVFSFMCALRNTLLCHIVCVIQVHVYSFALLRILTYTYMLPQKLNVPQERNENRMMTERCSELMLAAIANRCAEVWISTHPVLLFTYVAQYMPDVLRW